ncbi:beta/alpha barrel domain-containing protein [Desulfopila aestuarii]|uniref:Fructose-bisphosphate aldolase, class I n=1 Tax=Desulfopila aestuarii DSM 18488 TaxID=1121416 RepID=A0A1M7XVQ2_9BACT|nr:hypothetical protein [Desulfopila aestuarii]SHO42723.1 hypothetical protein SAMN02745220_00117 [Desulfopila aestuarii DSM 18488]
MIKSLDVKLKTIRSGAYTPKDFIIADAKDGDMAMGMAAPGPHPTRAGAFKSKADYLDAMRAMSRSGLIDIMLMSASSAGVLVGEGLFTESPVTPAVRLNDTTDIWYLRGNRYIEQPSVPFSTIDVEAATEFATLGLYSVTYSNDLLCDYETLSAYKEFRGVAADVGMRHFLEVFNPHPSVDTGLSAEDMALFINDAIARTVAGVVPAQQPLFLKMAYNGPKVMEELASYDPEGLIIGILGGSKGTTRDTFELISQAEKYGARVALFGRKINLAEDPISLVTLMRRVVEREVSPLEAVRAYHDELSKNGLSPNLSRDEDEQVTEPILKKG